jgi:hypothetical protein
LSAVDAKYAYGNCDSQFEIVSRRCNGSSGTLVGTKVLPHHETQHKHQSKVDKRGIAIRTTSRI